MEWNLNILPLRTIWSQDKRCVLPTIKYEDDARKIKVNHLMKLDSYFFILIFAKDSSINQLKINKNAKFLLLIVILIFILVRSRSS